MADLDLLLVALAAIYLSECVIWHRQGRCVLVGRSPFCRGSIEPTVTATGGGGLSFLAILPTSGHFAPAGTRTDTAAVSALVAQWNRALPLLQSACATLLTTILGGAVLLWATELWDALAVYWVVAVAMAWAAVLGVAVRTACMLNGGSLRASLSTCGMMFLSPITAVRAADRLGSQLLAPYHPIVVASIVCQPDEFGSLARRCVLSADADPASRRECEELLAVLAPSVLSDIPQREDGATAYCPRCWAQFHAAADLCPDCAVTIRTFALRDGH